MEQCLTIVGRSKTAKRFAQTVIEPFVDNLQEDHFEISEIDSLGDLSEIDGKSRFIAFVLVHDESKKGMQVESIFSTLIGLEMGVRLFENINDAKAYAEEHYNYGSAEEIELDEDEEDDEFENFTAEEIEDFLLFEALFRTGRLSTVRGKLGENAVTVMAQIINGPDQVRVTPYAIMLNEKMLEEIELPKINERD